MPEPNKPQNDRKPRQRPPKPPAPPRFSRGFMFWLLLFAGTIILVSLIRQTGAPETSQLDLNEFYDLLENGQINEVTLRNTRIMGEYRPEADQPDTMNFTAEILERHAESVETRLYEYNSRVRAGEIEGEQVAVKPDPGGELLRNFLLAMLPWLPLFIILWFVMARVMRSAGGGNSVMAFGKSRAKAVSKEKMNVTLDDVAGADEAKEDVQEMIEFLKTPRKFHRLGGRIPRGVLLVGQPGTGKTLLAKAVAGEADVPFYSISGSDFVEMFVGVGASRVRDLFKQAKESAPCIIFLDEIDAVGRRRGTGISSGHDEREQTLNAILVEMDGFERDESVIVFAATNRPDVLDPALLRPGRFDRQVVVDLPDIKGRKEILEVHARKYKISSQVNFEEIARGTPMFSGADLEALINEAALLATRKNKEHIEMDDLEDARDKVQWGRQKRSRVMDDEDRKITAIHESGHALVAKLLPETEPVHKVTIIPQGPALGATMALPEKDRYHVQRKKLLSQICMLLSGRVAEELACNDISSGAQNDLERATEIARAMVCRWGMSDNLGPISYHEHDNEEPVFLGRELTRRRQMSEAVAVKIDEEVRSIIIEQYDKARSLIEGNKDKLERMTEALLKYETLRGSELDKIIAGEEVPELEEKIKAEQQQKEQEESWQARQKEQKSSDYSKGSGPAFPREAPG